MAKNTETQETVDNSFDGFNWLNGSVPKSATKKLETSKEEDTEESEEEIISEGGLSEEATKALAEQEKLIAKTAKKKAPKEEEEYEEEVAEKEEQSGNEFFGFAKFLNEEGLIDLQDDDKFESEKDLAKAVERTIKNGIASDRTKLPEDGQKFLEFLDGGGRPSDFHKYYYGDSSFEDFDISSEENQKYVISEALKLEDYTQEEIDAELTDLEDLGKLDKKAETFLRKLQKVEKNQKDLLIQTQKAYAKEQEELRVKEWDDFRKGLFDKDTIGGFKMTPKMKEDTWAYMTKTVDKKTGETQYQKDSKENTEARYLFAYLLKNKWDMKALEKQVETRAVSKLKDKLSNYTDTRSKMKSGSGKAEMLDDQNNPFAAFKKALG
tara:strand:- start:5384 stop:6523 length:1140 start_codon:yes stop_codon:yes gene_type:complete